MCGKRLKVDPRWLAGTPPLPCGAYGALPLRQAVLHMQFTAAETRVHILEALHWWYVEPYKPPAAPSRTTTCAALAAGAGGGGASEMAGVVVSSAMANFSLLCVLPGAREGQAVELARAEGDCPCCWQIGAPPPHAQTHARRRAHEQSENTPPVMLNCAVLRPSCSTAVLRPSCPTA
eukprot:7327027-Prymnesium_polylepis.1